MTSPGEKSGTTFPGSEHDDEEVGRRENDTVPGRTVKKDKQISLELSVLERKTLLCRTVPKENKCEKMIYKKGDGAEINNILK